MSFTDKGLTFLANAPPAKSFCCIYVTHIHSSSASDVYQAPTLRPIVIPWGCTHSSILSVHSCVATCMCCHTTPCSCVIVVHTSSASATLRSSHAQYRWAGCQHQPLDIFCNGLLSSQAILQAASWPSPSFHKHTGDPTSCHAENHFYLSQSRCVCTRPLQPPKFFCHSPPWQDSARLPHWPCTMHGLLFLLSKVHFGTGA